MPASLSYTLPAVLPVVPLAPASPGSTVYSPETSRLQCPGEAMDQQHFLDLFYRVLPYEYLEPMRLNPSAGWEIFQAIAAVAARLSQAAEEAACGLCIASSSGASWAEVDVSFKRPAATAGAVTVQSGTLLTCSSSGLQFELISSAVFGSLDLGPITARARAVAPGYEYNVPGEVVTAGGEALPGEIDTISVMIQSPAFGDPSIFVEQPSAASGGSYGWLEAHAAGRGFEPADGESSDALRLRTRTLPDNLSPAAVRRAAERFLTTLGIAWELVETWSIGYQTCYDAPSPNAGTPTYDPAANPNPLYDSDLFCYDDPRSTNPFRNRWLDPLEMRGAFILVVDEDATVLDTGCAFDDPDDVASMYVDPVTGRGRALPAGDADLAVVAGLPQEGCFDGPDLARDGAFASIYDVLQAIKAAGVAAIMDHW